jgi:hypothetical protein
MKRKLMCLLLLMGILCAPVAAAGEGARFGFSGVLCSMPTGMADVLSMQGFVGLGIRSEILDFDLGYSSRSTNLRNLPYSQEFRTYMGRLGSKLRLSKQDFFTFGVNYFVQVDESSARAVSHSTAIGAYLGAQHYFTDQLVVELQCMPFMWSKTKYDSKMQYGTAGTEDCSTDFGNFSVGFTYLL